MASAEAEEWKKAEEDELQSMRVNNVLKTDKLPDGVRVSAQKSFESCMALFAVH